MGRPASSADADRTPQTPRTEDIPDPLGCGPVDTGPRRDFPVGTRRMSAAGYITVKCAGGLWESEGRLVVEKVLGRSIWPEEEIRHKPGVPQWDNRLEGLELWRNGRPARLPKQKAAKRTNWKRLYLAAIEVVERIDEGDVLGVDEPDDGVGAAVRRVLEERP